jgi:hypothetical protein
MGITEERREECDEFVGFEIGSEHYRVWRIG